MSVQDRINIANLDKLLMVEPKLGEKDVEFYLTRTGDHMVLARIAEEHMISALNAHPGLKAWFLSYEPASYMYDSNPNILRLRALVTKDNHTQVTFALCCGSVRRKLTARCRHAQIKRRGGRISK